MDGQEMGKKRCSAEGPSAHMCPIKAIWVDFSRDLWINTTTEAKRHVKWIDSQRLVAKCQKSWAHR